MNKIVKSKETMTSKERVKRTFEFEKTDRVTIGYEANDAIHQKFCGELGINCNNPELLYEALGVDYRAINAAYIGPEIFPPVKDRLINDLEGSVMRWIEHETCGYWDNCDFFNRDYYWKNIELGIF